MDAAKKANFNISAFVDWDSNVDFPTRDELQKFPLDSLEPGLHVNAVKSLINGVIFRRRTNNSQKWLATTESGGSGEYFSWNYLNSRRRSEKLELIEYVE